jgi:hypothetical protein
MGENTLFVIQNAEARHLKKKLPCTVTQQMELSSTVWLNRNATAMDIDDFHIRLVFEAMP